MTALYDRATKVVHVTLASGFTVSFPKERSQVTAQASDEQLQDIKIGAAGWTVDFPKLDDGLTIEGMLAGRFGNHRWEESWAREHQPAQAA